MSYKRTDILLILKSSRKKTTGFYVMNRYVKHSDLLRSNFNIKSITLNSSGSGFKLFYYGLSFLNIVYYSLLIVFKLIAYRPKVTYFTISPVNTFLRDVIYIFLIKLFNTELIYHIHGKGIKSKYHKSKIYRKLYKWAYNDVVAICLSEKLKYDFDFLPIKGYYVVPNAIPDYFKVENLDLKRRKENNKPLKVVYLSNLIASKGVFDFIDAIKLFIDDAENIEAYIVGKESEYTENDLKKRIGNYNDRIIYKGPLYDNQKYKFLSTCDILIFPTYYKTETWGLVILDAMQAGLPVITTDEGATTDMIENGVNGFIVNKKDPIDIKNKLLKFIDQPLLINEMGKRNREKYLEKFSIDAFEQNLSEIFDELIKKSK